jgi:beta-phosphoglucomutase family hydrolase
MTASLLRNRAAPDGSGPNRRRDAIIDPDRYDAVVFDLDGVVTDTTAVHAIAWRRLFDEYLATRPAVPGEDHSPFTADDYRRFVDGRSRCDGVTGFLISRGVTTDLTTTHELGDRKDQYFLEHLQRDGVQAFPDTIALIDRLDAAGLSYAVTSASQNCADILTAAGLPDVFELRVDGRVAQELDLPGKPDPAVFLLAARWLGVTPLRTVVVEDSLAGVEAGRAGGFGLVIGMDRTAHAGELFEHGADILVSDLSEVVVTTGREQGR